MTTPPPTFTDSRFKIPSTGISNSPGLARMETLSRSTSSKLEIFPFSLPKFTDSVPLAISALVTLKSNRGPDRKNPSDRISSATWKRSFTDEASKSFSTFRSVLSCEMVMLLARSFRGCRMTDASRILNSRISSERCKLFSTLNSPSPATFAC